MKNCWPADEIGEKRHEEKKATCWLQAAQARLGRAVTQAQHRRMFSQRNVADRRVSTKPELKRFGGSFSDIYKHQTCTPDVFERLVRVMINTRYIVGGESFRLLWVGSIAV